MSWKRYRAPVQLGCLVGLCVLPTAQAKQTPAVRHLDPTETQVTLVSSRATDRSGVASIPKYKFKVHFEVYGDGLTQRDVVRVDWKQNGQVLASQRCRLSVNDAQTFAATDPCELADASLDAVGDIQADVVFVDERSGAQTTLQTMNLKVARFPNYEGDQGRSHIHRWDFQILPDDLLGTSYAWFQRPDDGNQHGKIKFYFWAARRADENLPQPNFRCSVNGQPLGVDINLTSPTAFRDEPWCVSEEDRRWSNGDPGMGTQYKWCRYLATPQLVHGPANTPFGNLGRVNVADKPGDWSCELLSAGQPIREFRFKINADGTPALHPEQTGSNPLWLPPGTVLLDTRFPSTTFDFSIQPAAIRTSGFWGRPWSNPAGFSAMFTALPRAAVGTSNPPAVPGAPAPRGRGRR